MLQGPSSFYVLLAILLLDLSKELMLWYAWWGIGSESTPQWIQDWYDRYIAWERKQRAQLLEATTGVLARLVCGG